MRRRRRYGGFVCLVSSLIRNVTVLIVPLLVCRLVGEESDGAIVVTMLETFFNDVCNAMP